MKKITSRQAHSFMSRTTAILLFVSIALIFPLQVTAKERIKSYYRPQDNITFSYELDVENSNMTVMADGSTNDFYLRVYKGDREYGYHLFTGESSIIPLNMGSGKYNLELLLFIEGRSGETIWQSSFKFEQSDPMANFLSSSRIVNWTEDMELVSKAKEITDGLSTQEAALSICRYISQNYEYDYSITSLPSTYLPEPDVFFHQSKGICYDLTALYASMARSAGIPCKLVMGYSEYMGMDRYHAWCEVYVDDEWLSIDPTYSIDGGTYFLDSTKLTAQKYY